jgi:hypothetical protein
LPQLFEGFFCAGRLYLETVLVVGGLQFFLAALLELCDKELFM